MLLQHIYDGRYKKQEALFNVGLHDNLITLAHLSYFLTNILNIITIMRNIFHDTIHEYLQTFISY